MVATQEKLFGRVICEDRYASKGIYSFFFFKGGVWREVVVDDRIPVKVRDGYHNVLLFARSAEESELWVSLIEKAYAKLYGSYNALDGGLITEGITDLTGSLPSTIKFSDPEVQLHREALWERLKDLVTSGRHLCGTSASPKAGQAGEADNGNGIHVGHAYGVLSAVDYNGDKLVRCRNPWGEGEPKGLKWADDDKVRWTPKALADLGYDLENDGSFFITLEDLLSNFSQISVSTLLQPEWAMSSFKCAWADQLGTAQGCPNYGRLYYNNPQFAVHVRKPGTFHFCLSQGEVRGTPFEKLCIGMRVYATPGSLPSKVTGPRECLAKTVYINTRDAVLSVSLTPGYYTCIPSTFEPHQEGIFTLSIFSDAPYSAGPFDAHLDFRSKPLPVVNMASRGKAQEQVQRNTKAMLEQRISASGKRGSGGGGGGGYQSSATATDVSGYDSTADSDTDASTVIDEEFAECEIVPDDAPKGKLPKYVSDRLEKLKARKRAACGNKKCDVM